MIDNEVPFTSDTFYRSPAPRDDFECQLWKAVLDDSDSMDWRRLLEARTSSVGAGLIDYVVRRHDSDLLQELLLFPRWCFDYCGPVAIAVYSDDLNALKLLLSDRRIDCNVGAPVCVAVTHGRHSCLTELLKSERVNPNRGFPVVLAANGGDLASVRLLAELPTVQLNKFSSTGSTALLTAIRRGDETMTCFLLSNLRVDPNKGFYCTPLQLAVQLGRENCCRLLLARSSTAPNGAIGSLPSPLQLAVEAEHCEIVRMLLSDARVVVADSIIDYLEQSSKLQMLQLLILSQHFRIGKLWSLRTGAFFCAMFFLLMIFCFDLFFVVLTAETLAGVAVLCIHCFSGMISLFYIKKFFSVGSPKLLIAVPFFPLLEISAFTNFVWNLVQTKPDLLLREHQFILFEHSTKARAFFTITPLLLVRVLTISEFSGRALGASAFSTVLYCGLLSVSLWVRHIRIDVPRKQYISLQEAA